MQSFNPKLVLSMIACLAFIFAVGFYAMNRESPHAQSTPTPTQTTIAMPQSALPIGEWREATGDRWSFGADGAMRWTPPGRQSFSGRFSFTSTMLNVTFDNGKAAVYNVLSANPSGISLGTVRSCVGEKIGADLA